ncbi:MAG: hypothetical protein LBK42_02315 [Propionibacteriaceae bacterium]|jgi:hypothetical protein|nr:hypothetical protein [Propionibacteriaceae bacterium]
MTDSPWPTGPPPDPAQPAIARYAAPKRPSGLLILIVALLVVVAVAVALTVWNSDDPAATASPTISTSAAAPQRQGGSVIAQGGVQGYWRVTRTQWGRDSVTVQVQIEVDSGLLSCEFYAFTDAADINLNPRVTSDDDFAFGVVFVSAGQSINLDLTFDTTPTNLTIIMSDGRTQLSALRVEP